ncbi:hypothetical protein R4I43_20390 [Saccharopolyspora sp. S2-29]|uniref:Uncharacterized protein n=1 Tax=Saccharopolyspora mangrovi TaxID=3082379 RepID=A0ABU6ADZ0_9PSEU|nr:hypothetical protein [Saccharopolyspora sp. S2-29]MEB3369773.1 hypothetical protein [Saccharopolyspora sp. S2-29]
MIFPSVLCESSRPSPTGEHFDGALSPVGNRHEDGMSASVGESTPDRRTHLVSAVHP